MVAPDISPIVVALDIDRTILNTTKFVSILYEESLRAGASPAIIELLKSEEISSRGNSFDVISKLSFNGILPKIESLYTYSEDLLYKGVIDLLTSLRHDEVPFVLLTYGNKDAQEYKIRIIEHIVGFHLQYHITNEQNKSNLLERIEDDGIFKIPIDNAPDHICASSVILVDDKLSNLQTSHSRIHTILICNDMDLTSPHTGILLSEAWGKITALRSS